MTSCFSRCPGLLPPTDRNWLSSDVIVGVTLGRMAQFVMGFSSSFVSIIQSFTREGALKNGRDFILKQAFVLPAPPAICQDRISQGKHFVGDTRRCFSEVILLAIANSADRIFKLGEWDILGCRGVFPLLLLRSFLKPPEPDRCPSLPSDARHCTTG